MQRVARVSSAALILSAATACQGTLGNVLGSVLGNGNQELSGTVQGVDTRSQQVFLQQSNGQTVGIGYDNRTQVVYNNQNYSVTSLERGDQVTVRLVNNGNNTNNNYYTDYIRVDQSVSVNGGIGGGTSGNVMSFQGNVRQIDFNQGWFTLNTNNGILTVSMPYNANRNDVNRFQNLRTGDYVRLYGTYINNSRVQLQNFY
jgi:hypothetical protein